MEIINDRLQINDRFDQQNHVNRVDENGQQEMEGAEHEQEAQELGNDSSPQAEMNIDSRPNLGRVTNNQNVASRRVRRPRHPVQRRTANPHCFAQLYLLFSIFVALLAVLSPPSRIEHHHKHKIQTKGSAVFHGDIHSSVRKMLENDGHDETNQGKFTFVENTGSDEKSSSTIFNIFQKDSKQDSKNELSHLPHWLRWVEVFIPNQKDDKTCAESKTNQHRSLFSRILRKFVDPALFELWASYKNDSWRDQFSEVAFGIVDKVLTSTPRVVTIINLLLAVTYLLHSVVANFFLRGATAIVEDGVENHVRVENASLMSVGVGTSALDRLHRSGRERLGGYLLFKLLLITAVVEPDVLDLLILLTWYTLLAFLRSLSYLAGITTSHTAASGQSPHRGVLKLLVVVLICDICAATTCAALFHGAGIGMVLLLNCDCVLLSLDVCTHLARFTQQILNEKHEQYMAYLEWSQIQLHEQFRNVDGDEYDSHDLDEEFREQARRIDHEMESKESTNTTRLAAIDYLAFILELFSLSVTIIHFLHVWVLHGLTFNLVDGVLALHLHSAISAFGKKIHERRNHNRIAKELDTFFRDATDMELEKASIAGDVCCICLGTMSMGNVKKVGCGHLYHTHCLREVVERAHSFEAARCPLCRASVVDGKQYPESNNVGPGFPLNFGGNNNVPANENEGNNDANDNQVETVRAPVPNLGQQNERALFRLSTEGLFPQWLPIPQFSFEVVRRFPPGMPELDTPNTENDRQDEAQGQLNPGVEVQERDEPSIWRRILTMAGALPMSQEEENSALASLVDMFPQYNRDDLLRELRDRGSAEAVVESVLGGSFIGAQVGIRTEVVANNDLNQQPDEDGSE